MGAVFWVGVFYLPQTLGNLGERNYSNREF